MRPRHLVLRCLTALSLACASGAFAQQPAFDDEDKRALESFLTDKLSDVLSKKTDVLQLKYIEPDAPGEQAGWGVDYSWKASKDSYPDMEPEDGQPFSISRLSYELAIDGSYAFDDTRNNQDLSTITANLKLSRGNFGTLHVIPKEAREAYIECVAKTPAPKSPEDQKLFDRALDMCAQANGIQQKYETEDQRAYYYWLDFHGGVEANQDYSQTHTLFGLAAAIAYQPNSKQTNFNIFDMPFSWLRRAFGSAEFAAPYPSLLLGIDRLDADEQDPRSALTTDTTFNRIKAEVAFATQLANFNGQIVRLTTSYRYYQEMSAPAAVKAANLDEFDFFTASVRFPAKLLPLIESDAYELFVSYTNGKLPFDVANGQTFEVGISTNIDSLARFLAK